MTETVLTETDIAKAMDRARDLRGSLLFSVRLARVIESAVLQSPEVVALRRDAERYRWLRDSAFCGVWGRGDGISLVVPRTPETKIDAAIDAAMEAES